ncbi:hypothetical protein AAIB33_17880 [Microbacterium sp. AZCO]|uniref:hypothetical protein n=1 Tax=Microbacterium sp. AZCO TaxID=3142976 RepID=UPI0031F3962E
MTNPDALIQPEPASDPGNPNRDRGDLQDLPPAQVDDEAVREHAEAEAEEAEGEGPGGDAAAARS